MAKFKFRVNKRKSKYVSHTISIIGMGSYDWALILSYARRGMEKDIETNANEPQKKALLPIVNALYDMQRFEEETQEAAGWGDSVYDSTEIEIKYADLFNK